MPVADRPDRHAAVSEIANKAHANGQHAATAVMIQLRMSDRSATKAMSLARKAGYTIARDSDRRTPEQVQQWRRSVLYGFLNATDRHFDLMTWREEGNCRGVDVNLFFPERGANVRVVNEAKQVCRGCQVRRQCFEYGIQHHELGIWGGTSEIQRRRIRAGWITFEDCA